MQKFSPLAEQVINAVNHCDEQAIIDIIRQASDKDCHMMIQELNPSTYLYENEFLYRINRSVEKDRVALDYFMFALLIMVRDSKDFEILLKNSHVPLIGYVMGKGFTKLFDFYQQKLPDYLQKEVIDFIKYRKKDGFIVKFIPLWCLYQQGFIKYDETYFMRCLMEVEMFTRSTLEDAKFLAKTPQATALLYKMTQYETAVLNLSKWEIANGETVCDRVTNFWDEVFALIQQQGFEFDQAWLGDLLQSLTLPWKKPHLEWHCRVINFLQPSQDELIDYQTILFANLSSPVPSIIKYNLEWIERIYQDYRFDLQSFQDSLVQIFVLEKQAKTLSKALQMLIYSFEKYPPDVAYREQLALLLTQSDMKLQTQVATVLMQYFNDDGLAEVILPYQDYFNTKTQAVFEPSLVNIQSPKISISDTQAEPPQPLAKPLAISDLTPISLPQTWHDVLFLIGDCVREPSAHTIDVFFEGVNRLQGEFPADFAKQLEPYLKSLNKSWSETAVLPILQAFLICLSEQKLLQISSKYKYTQEEYYKIRGKDDTKLFNQYKWQYEYFRAKKMLPYLAHKAETLLNRIIEKSEPFLPLLATPTHEPFYVDANEFADRILQYQQADVELDIEELVVACNRLVRSNIDDTAKQKAQRFKGKCQNALQYLFELHDEIVVNELADERLPLWTQISRLKHPNCTFEAFRSTTAHDIVSVVEPYYIGYGERTRTYYAYNDEEETSYTFFQYDYNPVTQNRDKDRLNQATTHLYYHAYMMTYTYLPDLAYNIGLDPFYSNALFCSLISSNATLNEAQEIKEMTNLMKFIIENKLEVQHSGWLFIGACLLFEKKPVQIMGADFIVQAIESGNHEQDLVYMQGYIADMIADEQIPLSRLLAFFDKPDNQPNVVRFKLATIEHCLAKIDSTKPPRGYKKLLAYQQEFSKRVGNLA